MSSRVASRSTPGNPYVEFYSTQDEGQVVAGRAEMTASGIAFSGRPFSPRMIQMFHSRGIHDANGRFVKLAAGMPFLRALRCEFTGSYFRASRVKGVRCRVLRFRR